MSENPQNNDSNKQIRESLDEIVEKLDKGYDSSAEWDSKIQSQSKKWENLKRELSAKQKALKQLVESKKAGIIGQSEFDEKYAELQDELTQLEFQVYNMRLGTNVEM